VVPGLVGSSIGGTAGGKESVRKTKNILRTIAVVGVLGGLATAGSYSAFSGQAENPGNELKAGTVSLLDNDLGGSLYKLFTRVHASRILVRCSSRAESSSA